MDNWFNIIILILSRITLMKRKIFIAAVAVLFVILQFGFIWDIFGGYVYRDAVYDSAVRFKVDSLLIFAIIKAESNFTRTAQSRKGAVGLMQIMPDLAVSYVLETGDNIDDLLRPENNIKVGVWYVSKLRRIFDNDIVLVLAAYNSGENNVRKWLRDGPISDLEYIPFPETRNFVRRTLSNYKTLKIVQAFKRVIKVF